MCVARPYAHMHLQLPLNIPRLPCAPPPPLQDILGVARIGPDAASRYVDPASGEIMVQNYTACR